VTLVAVVLIIAVFTTIVVSFLRARGGIVSKRGMSIGADVASLSDQRRVRVVAVTSAGHDRVRVVLTAEAGGARELQAQETDDLDLVVALDPSDFGFGLLQQWAQSGSVLALVMPDETSIVRLRSLDDMQPVTLRRVDG
jgi:hypothetical protein